MFDKSIKDEAFEVEMEFTIQRNLNKVRGFMMMLTTHELEEKEFAESDLGYRTDFEGISVFVFRH